MLYPATKSVFRISKYSFKRSALGRAFLVVFSFLAYIVCLSICLSASYLGICVIWANKQWSFNKLGTKGSVKHSSFCVVPQYLPAWTCCWFARQDTISSRQQQQHLSWRGENSEAVTIGICRAFAYGGRRDCGCWWYLEWVSLLLVKS